MCVPSIKENSPLFKTVIVTLLFPLLFLAGCSIMRGAKTGGIPDASLVINKYIDATGGRAAHDAVMNRVTKGRFTIEGQAITGEMTIYVARPAKMCMVIESAQFGAIEQGIDKNGIVWEITPFSEPRIAEEKERVATIRDSRLDKFTAWSEIYKKTVCAGIDSVGGHSCYRLEAESPDGEIQTFFFDRNSGLLVKTEATIYHPQGTFLVETYYDDYRTVDGVGVAYSLKIIVMDQERILTVKKIQHNVELEGGLFDLPPEIETLLREKR